MMGHREKLKNGLEFDIIFERHILCYLKNIPGIVRFGKRSMNRRTRKQAKKEIRNLIISDETRQSFN